jgi:diguanylate cyclase (GGDEF)-like protein/PAS domain S-box-containing protein
VSEKKELLQRAVEAAEHGIYITSPDGVLEYVNPAFCAITGYAEEELLGKRMSVLRSGEMDSEYYRRMWSSISRGSSWQEEIVNRRKNGDLYWAFQIIAPVTDRDGEVIRYVGIQNDTTEARALREERDQALAELDGVFSGSQDALFLIDVEEDGTFRYRKLNPAHERLTGLTTAAVRGRTPHQVLATEAARRVVANYTRCTVAVQPVSYEEELDLPGGRRTWHTQLAPIVRAGRVVQIVGAARDISERKQMEEELRYLSEMDPLTGIANRRKVREELEREIARATRHSHPLSLLILDIDRFKAVNDQFGHETGDAVLRAVSSTIEAMLRPSDRLGRWGGEEFVVILPVTSAAGALVLAERVRKAICDSRAVPDYPITASVGVASLRSVSEADPDGPDTVDTLVRRADERLYRAKHDGRNRTCAEDPPGDAPPAG